MVKHRWLSIIEGCVLVAFGVQAIQAGNLLVGGTAGLSLTLSVLHDLSFGQIFFLINLPCYLLAFKYMGARFTLTTFASVSLFSGLSELLDRFLTLQIAEPLVAAVLGGVLIGFGLTVLFRSQSSLGGFNILSVFLDKQFGINTGKSTLAFDLLVVAFALTVFEPMQVLYSVAAFAAMSAVIIRYIKTPAEKQAELNQKKQAAQPA